MQLRMLMSFVHMCNGQVRHSGAAGPPWRALGVRAWRRRRRARAVWRAERAGDPTACSCNRESRLGMSRRPQQDGRQRQAAATAAGRTACVGSSRAPAAMHSGRGKPNHLALRRPSARSPCRWSGGRATPTSSTRRSAAASSLLRGNSPRFVALLPCPVTAFFVVAEFPPCKARWPVLTELPCFALAKPEKLTCFGPQMLHTSSQNMLRAPRFMRNLQLPLVVPRPFREGARLSRME